RIAASGPAAGPQPGERGGSLPGAATLLRGGARNDAGPDEPRRPPDVPGRAPHETRPDEHVRVRGEPSALPRPRAGRARGQDAREREAPRPHDQGGPETGAT